MFTFLLSSDINFARTVRESLPACSHDSLLSGSHVRNGKIYIGAVVHVHYGGTFAWIQFGTHSLKDLK